eukprot:Gb_27064 [translate_table: standard]
MLLRSSSTPILGSMIPKMQHSENITEKEGKTISSSENMNQFCFHNANPHPYSSVEEGSEIIPSSSFRRAQSESDLRSLGRGSPARSKAGAESCLHGMENSYDDSHLSFPKKHWSRRVMAHKRFPPLKSIPSFSCYYNEEEREHESLGDEGVTKNNNGGFVESHQQEFSFENGATGQSFGGMMDLADVQHEQVAVSSAPLFMARGLGVDVVEPLTEMGGGNGNSFRKGVYTGGGGGGDGFGAGSDNIEENYQRMLEENPTNSLLLRNYAQFLYESKHDYHKAEEYYSRAILAQPDDGEVLSQYAKLIWELHGDEERASTYFQQAVQASPADCHVLAAYASFLWNTDKDEEEHEDSSFSNGSYIYGTVSSATATVS